MHLPGGTHRKTPLSVVLIVDRASRLLAEAGVDFGVVEVKVMTLKVFELIEGEAKVQGMSVHLMEKVLSCAGVKGMVLWLSS